MSLNALNLTDGYKLDHRRQYPDKTTLVYSNWTPRSSRIKGMDKVVFFGLQYFIKKYLIEDFNQTFFSQPKEKVVAQYKRRIDAYLGKDNLVGTKHIEDLHDLGYLPIEIKALPEGSLVDVKIPMLTMKNTHPDFFWLVNYFETILSTTIWMPCTSATLALEYRKIMTKYATETGGDLNFVPFQGHDFSFRGMAGLEAAMMSGAAHLLSFSGTDTLPAIDFLEEYYGANAEKELVGVSVPATEHSVMCSGLKDNELDTFRRLINNVYPSGIVSIVSDSWDFWKVVTEYLPMLKDEIMNRDGKCVIRPDSGNPVDIVCGNCEIVDLTNKVTTFDRCKKWMVSAIKGTVCGDTPHGECGEESASGIFKFQDKFYEIEVQFDWNRYDKQYYFIDGCRVTECEEVELEAEQKGLIECLWDTFGGTVNEQGYKVLDPHIGAIYGDSITLERCQQICERLKQKGFASTNIVFGIGSFTYQYNTRDTFGFAVKATYVEVDGQGREIFKDPKTDNGGKKSAKGLMQVERRGLSYHLHDQVSWLQENGGSLSTVFKDGKLTTEITFSEIKSKVARYF